MRENIFALGDWIAKHRFRKFNLRLNVPSLPPLLYADTRSNADMLYFGRVEVHDPFVAFGARGKRITVQSALEFGRVKRTSVFDTVLSRETSMEKARARYGAKAGVAEMIACLAREYRIRAFRIADDFPAALYLKLRKAGLRLEFANGQLFPEREIKTPAEIAAIREGNRLAAVGFATAEKILGAAKITGRKLIHQGRPVTSEGLRFAIETAIRAEGGDPRDTIVAGGNQACDPHERGTGPLRPHELIILDIFPRVTRTGYYGDMTRTYLKGRATDAQRKLVATVREAHRAAIRMIRAGVDGQDVHELVNFVFSQAGYKTQRGRSGSVGFIHGTGHGLGLDVHEPPRMSAVSCKLKAGTVVTVEPGLYYPGLGGCRWEDVVQVTALAPRLLSRHPYQWEIR
jgi:Xaa-Pro aminopeptidase